MKDPEDEEFERIAREQARLNTELQELKRINKEFDEQYEIFKRNEVLEEVAKEFDKLKNFGDTSQSFATFVRNMKR